MKKLLTLLFVFCILFTVPTFGSAAEILAKDDNYAYHHKIVCGLSMIPDELKDCSTESIIRRGDFAETVCLLMNMDGDSGYNHYFHDVDSSSAEGNAINMLADRKILRGDGDGYFFPDEGISGRDAVKVFLRMLGYGIYDELEEYPKALHQAGLTDCTAEALDYKTFINLIYDALYAKVLKPVSFGEKVEYSQGNNLLYEYHKISSDYGIVTANAVSVIPGYEEAGSEEIRINDRLLSAEENLYAELLGYPVEYFFDETTTLPKLRYATVSRDAEVLRLKANDIVDYNNLTYRFESGSRIKTAQIAANHCLIVNGVVKKVYDQTEFTPVNGDVILVAEKKGAYRTVIINTFESFWANSATAGGTSELTFTAPKTLQKLTVDFANDNCVIDMYMDGVKQNLKPFSWDYMDEITEGYIFPYVPQYSVINIFADTWDEINGHIVPGKDARRISIYVSTQKVSGIIEGIFSDTGQVQIQGKRYEIAPKNMIDLQSVEFAAGESGDFVLDYDGKVAAWIPENRDNVMLYGYLIQAVSYGTFSSRAEAKLMDTRGEIFIAQFADRVTVNDEVLKDCDAIIKELSISAKLLDDTFTISQPLKYMLDENGAITKIETVLASVGVPDGVSAEHMQRVIPREKLASRSDNGYMLYRYSTNNPEFNNYTAVYTAPEICIFHVPTKETFDEMDYTVDAWSPDYSSKVVDVFDVDDFRTPKIVVSYDDNIGALALFSRPYVVVQETGRMLDDDGNEVSYLKGAEGYGQVVFYSEDMGMFEGLNTGDIVQIYGKSYEVEKVEVYLSIEDIKEFDMNQATVPDEIKKHVYELYDVTSRNLILQRGFLGENGKRNYQRGSYWKNNVSSLLHGAILYDGSKKGEEAVKPKAALTDLKTVKQFGNGSASRIFVIETNAMMKFLVIYNNLN